MEREFITYGIHIDPEKFNRISNERPYLNKPSGGLWCSPVNSNCSWKDWCTGEDFNVGSLKTWTKFKLKETANILVIDSLVDLVRISKKYPLIHPHPITFDKLINFKDIEKDGYDGVLLTERGNCQCHLTGIGIDLNAWDCESMVLFNLEHIEIEEMV
jgi:hypothetical protein